MIAQMLVYYLRLILLFSKFYFLLKKSMVPLYKNISKENMFYRRKNSIEEIWLTKIMTDLEKRCFKMYSKIILTYDLPQKEKLD